MKGHMKATYNPHSRWAIDTFVRFLNNGPLFFDLVDAFPKSTQPHLKRKLTTIYSNSCKRGTFNGSYVQNVIDFYNYLDEQNKLYLLFYIQSWADERDGEVKPTAENDTRQLETDNRQLHLFVDDLSTQ